MHGRSGRLLWTTIFSQNPGILWQSASSNSPQSQMDGTLCTVLSPVGQIRKEKQTLMPRVQTTRKLPLQYLVSSHFHTWKYWNMMKHVSMMWHVPFNLTVSSFHRPASSVQSLGWQLDIRGMPPGKCMFWASKQQLDVLHWPSSSIQSILQACEVPRNWWWTWGWCPAQLQR